MALHIFLTLLLLRSSLAAFEDPLDLPELYNTIDSSPEEDLSGLESPFERQSRQNGGDKYLRFGRSFWDYDYGNDVKDKDNRMRPTRTDGRQDKNDQFIRFGRSGAGRPEFLRLTGGGAMQQRIPRDKSGFLRFGRSISEESNKKKRDKRQTDALKRQENFLRFGRSGGAGEKKNSNSNFLRFGRNLVAQSDSSLRDKYLVEYLRSLLKQVRRDGSEDVVGNI